MYIRVDDTEDEIFQGFSYRNQDGEDESVQISKEWMDCLAISLTNHPATRVYVKDVPNLIKALQKAYDHLGGANV